MTSKTIAEFDELWNARNNEGLGGPVDNETADINGLGDELGELLNYSLSSDEIAIYRDADGRIAGVGDAGGPWVVYLD